MAVVASSGSVLAVAAINSGDAMVPPLGAGGMWGMPQKGRRASVAPFPAIRKTNHNPITFCDKDYCITGRANPISCAVGLR